MNNVPNGTKNVFVVEGSLKGDPILLTTIKKISKKFRRFSKKYSMYYRDEAGGDVKLS